jgi:cytochrome c biogenesis protein
MAARERQGLPRLELTPARTQFVQDSLNAMSDTFFYGVPLYLQLAGYDEVKASVLQLTRSPGKIIVYWGCALLVLGIFAMFFIRERRLWILLKPSGQVKMALSCNRTGLDADEEFARHCEAVSKLVL